MAFCFYSKFVYSIFLYFIFLYSHSNPPSSTYYKDSRLFSFFFSSHGARSLLHLPFIISSFHKLNPHTNYLLQLHSHGLGDFSSIDTTPIEIRSLWSNVTSSLVFLLTTPDIFHIYVSHLHLRFTLLDSHLRFTQHKNNKIAHTNHTNFLLGTSST